MATRCREADPIPKVPDAGKSGRGKRRDARPDHAQGPESRGRRYYGRWMTKLIGLCRGHHEPQEERAFHEVVSRLGPTAAMAELWWLLGVLQSMLAWRTRVGELSLSNPI